MDVILQTPSLLILNQNSLANANMSQKASAVFTGVNLISFPPHTNSHERITGYRNLYISL